jgi:hypothetical protein
MFNVIALATSVLAVTATAALNCSRIEAHGYYAFDISALAAVCVTAPRPTYLRQRLAMDKVHGRWSRDELV